MFKGCSLLHVLPAGSACDGAGCCGAESASRPQGNGLTLPSAEVGPDSDDDDFKTKLPRKYAPNAPRGAPAAARLLAGAQPPGQQKALIVERAMTVAGASAPAEQMRKTDSIMLSALQLSYAKSSDSGALQVIFHAWKGLLTEQKLVWYERSEKLMMKSLTGLGALRCLVNSTSELLRMCFKEWRRHAVETRLVRNGYLQYSGGTGFRLVKGDQVIVDSKVRRVQHLCEGDMNRWGGGWNYEKEQYCGKEGMVIGRDWIGYGIRVRFDDGHWWSYAPEALHVKLSSLPAERRRALEAAATKDLVSRDAG
eukprot:TRINITY_DN28605_c0_g1_i2.p1 TRINITY_DN28605_c0_g1~~TRINITY_DN28605_c0_g1_i2.p1  ORF type:complete len:309 (-),score=76.50 TRINITY_DN28605_c0_g1_i2:421-1347(-)